MFDIFLGVSFALFPPRLTTGVAKCHEGKYSKPCKSFQFCRLSKLAVGKRPSLFIWGITDKQNHDTNALGVTGDFPISLEVRARLR